MTRSHPARYRPAPPVGPALLSLPSTWVRWLLEEAGRRHQPVVAVCREPDGSWQICSPELLWSLDGSQQAWNISQRQGCRGRYTRLELVHNDIVCGALLEDRAPGCAEQEGWRVLVLEALVLAKRGHQTSPSAIK